MDDLLGAFLATLDDARVSRGERRALRELLADDPLTADQRLKLQQDLIAAVRDRLIDPRDKTMIDGLSQALSLLRPHEVPRSPARVYFGPEDPMVETLEALISGVRKTLDIAVFTITDNRLYTKIVQAHDRGVHVRVLTDDDKAHDRGSDAWRLEDAGIEVAYDHSPHHFHHKFVVIDDNTVVTGSYNWTRGADHNNRENFVVSHNPRLVRAYGHAFDDMWRDLGPSGS